MQIVIGEIVRNVPAPKRESNGRPKGVVRDAIDSLSVGDSVFFGFEANDKAKATSRIRGIANMAARKSGIRFSTSADDCGIRVWRTE